MSGVVEFENASFAKQVEAIDRLSEQLENTVDYTNHLAAKIVEAIDAATHQYNLLANATAINSHAEKIVKQYAAIIKDLTYVQADIVNTLAID